MLMSTSVGGAWRGGVRNEGYVRVRHVGEPACGDAVVLGLGTMNKWRGDRVKDLPWHSATQLWHGDVWLLGRAAHGWT